jgi:hypothetical protein
MFALLQCIIPFIQHDSLGQQGGLGDVPDAVERGQELVFGERRVVDLQGADAAHEAGKGRVRPEAEPTDHGAVVVELRARTQNKERKLKE